MGDRVGHLPALGDARAAFDAHGDELGRALAVAHDRLREPARDLDDRVAQRAAFGRCRDRVIGALPARWRRDQDERIVGRGVAVDRDAVERLVGRLAHEALQQRRIDDGIGGDEAEHRRHVRMDHAGALADAGDGDASGRRSRP